MNIVAWVAQLVRAPVSYVIQYESNTWM